jgi:glycogen operon protein
LFDTQDCPPGLFNYWGYVPISFFAPHHGYSSRQVPLGPVDEFRDMVKALHLADIEVMLDVVYNHTAEGDQRGPTLCFRGLGNSIYYILEEDRSRYANYSGTGNTLNANQPIVRRMIVDSLRYWVEQMHVDGFRFDLASILARDSSGQPMSNPPVLWDVESDPVLAGTKFIAEAGTRLAYIRWAALSDTVGRSGTDDFAMMSVLFSVVNLIPWGASRTDYSVAPKFTATKDATPRSA